MLLALAPRRRLDGLALAFGLNLFGAYARLQIQQPQLGVAELLARRPVLADPFQPQLLLQRENQHIRQAELVLGPFEIARQYGDPIGFGQRDGECGAHSR